jgi:hypothetical protein
MNRLPRHLRAALRGGHTERETWVLVQQLELYGVRVAVVRLQLGDLKGEGFGQFTEIYRSPDIDDHTPA